LISMQRGNEKNSQKITKSQSSRPALHVRVMWGVGGGSKHDLLEEAMQRSSGVLSKNKNVQRVVRTTSRGKRPKS